MEGFGLYTHGDPEKAYIDGCTQGQFAYSRCRACRGSQLASRRTCIHCGATDLEIEQAGGEGVITSFTEVHRAASPHFAAQLPLILVLVDMDEEFRAMMQFRGPAKPKIGDRIRIGFAPYGPQGEMLPFAQHLDGDR